MLNIHQLLQDTIDLPEVERTHFIEKIPKLYKVYLIKKKTGGHRTIAQPTKKIKEIQRDLVTYLQKYLPVHKAAFAYRKKIGIKNNADLHKSNDYILKLDLSNFFNSIKPIILDEHFKKLKIDLNPQDARDLRNVVFWNPTKKNNAQLILSVGAPSSPFISNTIMYFFDTQLHEYCLSKKITYSRYADDMTFSTKSKDILYKLPLKVKRILKSEFGTLLYLNDSKTIYSSKRHNRHVTGITITNTGELSIGRAKKRYISSLIHKLTLNKLNEDEHIHLQGLVAHAFHIEPMLKSRLIKKYGIKVINSINKEASNESGQ